jgi:hypothetical protein
MMVAELKNKQVKLSINKYYKKKLQVIYLSGNLVVRETLGKNEVTSYLANFDPFSYREFMGQWVSMNVKSPFILIICLSRSTGPAR